MRGSFKGYARLQRLNAAEGFTRAATVLAVVFFVAYSYLTLQRYEKLLCGAWDLAIFDSLFHNALHGHIFVDYRGPFDHFQPGLALVLPFYAAWQDPRMLLIFRAAVLALAAWPLYLLAQEISGNRVVASVATMRISSTPSWAPGRCTISTASR